MVDEYWYSEDLHVNLMLRHSDPRTGEQTITLKEIERAEPALEFFLSPAGLQDRGYDAARQCVCRGWRWKWRHSAVRLDHRAVRTNSDAARSVSGSSPKPSIQCTSGSRRNQVNCLLA